MHVSLQESKNDLVSLYLFLNEVLKIQGRTWARGKEQCGQVSNPWSSVLASKSPGHGPALIRNT